MQFTVEQIAHILGGEVLGDASAKVWDIGKIEDAQLGQVSFLSNLKYEPYLYTTKATVVIINKDFQPKHSYTPSLIRVENAYSAFTVLLEEYEKIIRFSKVGIEQPCFMAENSDIGEGFYRGAFSYIGNNTNIGKNVKIYPQAFIGDNVKIGDNCLIYAGARILDGTVVGNNCTIHPNAVVGSDGFGFAPQPDKTYRRIPQVGIVILEDNVSIGANSTIDRATLGVTILRKGVKIDNLVQVAHNVEIGENTVMAAQSGVAGSAKIGKNCQFGGQTGIAGHIEVAEATIASGRAGITAAIKEPKQILSGMPAFSHKNNMRSYVIYRKLPELDTKVKDLERKIVDLQSQLENPPTRESE
jgi:UDP-3-O-[3-hydroxymyristoyl] glucosamine N-acyltransferase